MSKIQLTPEQNLAVNRRSSLLVSAAAGSGKTRVLTSRLMAYVSAEDELCDINEFLIITFTRAAAAELRGRILSGLTRLSGENPQNRRLRRQVSLCYKANIGTIHSFCTMILRENSHKLDLSPDFSVGDESRCNQLKEKALSKALEAAYESIAENPDFAALAETIGVGTDDSRLVDTLGKLRDKIQSHPFPKKWVRQQLSAMELSGITDPAETPWGKQLMDDAKKTVSFWFEKLNNMWVSICENPDENSPLIDKYGENIAETMSGLAIFSNALEKGWDAAIEALPIPFSRLPTLTKFEYAETQDYFKAVRKDCKDACERLRLIFDASGDTQLARLRKTAPAMRALLELALDFDLRYIQEKRRHNILDFSDLEHLTAELLCDSETLEPTELARNISRRYREILVDEYQDVNAVQELIVNSISRDGRNIFMVGDVKQSIYRFRLADPGIFLRKLSELPRADTSPPDETASVLLSNNFRSDRAVLSACNSIFSKLMSSFLGEVDYNADSALYPPETAPPPRGEAKLFIISTEGGDDDDELPDKNTVEAKFVAGRIKEMVERGETIRDGETERPLNYGDFAILIRSANKLSPVYNKALAAAGVPIVGSGGNGFFASDEIVVMTALLSVIDSPRRDIPLMAVLSSPLFGYTPDELAWLRSKNRSMSLYDALCIFAAEHEKSRQFLESLDHFRMLCAAMSIYELIGAICDRLELPALWTAARGTTEAAENLVLYMELSAQLESGGWRSLSDFLARLKIMEEQGLDPSSGSAAAGQAVRVMSIHKSKGLEFPVVFLCDTSRKFNKLDLANPVLIHSELGLGGKITDTERRIEFPGIAHRAIKSRLDSEQLSEEMRVLYVALTRAKERLYITCTTKDPLAFIEKRSQPALLPLAAEQLRRAQNMAEWLVSAACADKDETVSLEVIDSLIEHEPPENTMLKQHAKTPDPQELEALRTVLNYRYPFEHAAAIPSKITATALSRLEADEDSASLLAPRARSFSLPKLAEVERALFAAEKGIATHTVMQFINFSKTASLPEIECELSRITALGHLDERQAKAVDKRAISRFFTSETGKRIVAAENTFREFRFSLLVPSELFYPDAGSENILLQGVIDCCIEEAGELTIIDYKTDYVTAETLEEKAQYYRPQLAAYALAMERITKKTVRGCILCFLRAGLETHIPFKGIDKI